MTDSLLHRWFPEAVKPLIISSPMFTVSNGRLAAEVSKAGGLGMVSAGLDPAAGSPHLAALDEQLTLARELLDEGKPSDVPLQVGVGFITLLASVQLYRVSVVPIISKHKPAFVWLFGSDPSETLYEELISLFHATGETWQMKVFIQVGTVRAAKQIVRAGADVVVIQGSDAGGHQWAKAASLMTLLPEVIASVQDKDIRGHEFAVVAAGGIIDGRGVAAALALGAGGVVMGTRFITSPETDAESYVRKAVLDTEDGGATTTVSCFHDGIQGYPTWSSTYAGRTITHPGIVELENGVAFEEVVASFKKARECRDHSRLVTWAGTGIGLVTRSQPAGEIVREVRDEALQIIGKLATRYSKQM
ncbi:2-nitropropane dioxygenase [Xylariales sp. AK1849]|nr:2-nitropropane dioxygenase [Xylariales sp. AK1849]